MTLGTGSRSPMHNCILALIQDFNHVQFGNTSSKSWPMIHKPNPLSLTCDRSTIIMLILEVLGPTLLRLWSGNKIHRNSLEVDLWPWERSKRLHIRSYTLTLWEDYNHVQFDSSPGSKNSRLMIQKPHSISKTIT